MRVAKVIAYVASFADFEPFRQGLKLMPCPHCGAVGFLICHGFLRGYNEEGLPGFVRGRRFYCSNRGRKRGCGRTFSVLLAGVLRRCIVPARTLWQFLQGLWRGLNRKAAWERTTRRFSLETAYRLARRVNRRQSALRTLLARRSAPPQSDSPEPLVQLLAHLENLFAASACPIAAFQSEFQQPFLG